MVTIRRAPDTAHTLSSSSRQHIRVLPQPKGDPYDGGDDRPRRTVQRSGAQASRRLSGRSRSDLLGEVRMSAKQRGFRALANKALDQADTEIASGTPAGQTQGEAAMDSLSNGASQVRVGSRAYRVAPQSANDPDQPTS